MSATQTLIIDLADLPSLTAIAIQPEGQTLVLWHPGCTDASAARRVELVQRHGDVFSAADVVLSEPSAFRSAGMPQWFVHSELLLQALAVAERMGCARIIWPHQVGPAFEQIGPVVERVATLASLPGMAEGREPVPIDLPLVDLTDEQVVELADDSGASLRAFWPCGSGEAQPCGGCDGCRRWADAFEQVGVAWPWSGEAVAVGVQPSGISG